MKKYTFVILLMISSTICKADACDSICNAIKSGDPKKIALYFENSVDLTILDKEDVYSNVQAELILRDFFSKNHPKEFTILHKGASKEQTLYGIGTLLTTDGKTFRVSFYIKSSDGKNVLEELRIETE